MKKITIQNTKARDFHQFMLGGITPRPIALVSTLSDTGISNLAPFSYFNAVSSIPPIVMLSVGRKPDGSKKDTLENIEKSGEFVVNMVPYELMGQMALSSVALSPDSDEFEFAGLNKMKSDHIKAWRVKESPIHFECRVNRILELGSGPGESSLILGDVLCIHIDEKIIDQNNRIDPIALKVLGRLGRSYYTKTDGATIETLVQPQHKIPIGFERLPETIKRSKYISANSMSKLAACYQVPDRDTIHKAKVEMEANSIEMTQEKIHKQVQNLIEENKIEKALLLAFLSASIIE